ncbi:MAG TPA: F0F1 ATP synthase subunit delta [Ruminiclostridium sp.]|nr:F0F1 ATP synthase subunit delta [Ruminiclostridium sp.]
MSTVANRYAKALLDLAVSDGAVDGYQGELSAVSQIYEAESALNTFLLSPQKDLTTKKNVLTNIFNGTVRKNVLNLLLVLADKGRIELLPDINLVFTKMADEYRNILNITITSALPLNKEQTDIIGEKFRSLYHVSSVKITVETDESLVGGVKVAVGDKLYDGTVRGKLSKMQSALGLS